MTSRRHAFTLIELTVTIAILAILAAVVTVSARGACAGAELSTTIERVAMAHRLAQAAALRSGKSVSLVFNLDHDDLTRDDGKQRSIILAARGVDLTELVIRRTGTANLLDRRFGGEATIQFSALGICPPYALLLNAGQGRQRWLYCSAATTTLQESAFEPTFP